MEQEELFCSVCTIAVGPDDEICQHCGSELIEYENLSPSERKYKTLMRIKEGIRIFVSLLGTLLMVGLLYGIYIKSWDVIMLTIIPIVNIAVLLIFFELINVFVDLEQNSRTQVRLLNKLLMERNQN